jgi:hypothetical protein
MPGGFPDLGNAFSGFGSFRGLDLKLCNTSLANDKRPDEQKSAVADTIRSQKQDMDSQYGPDVPDRVKKCKIVSFGEESIGMLDAITDKAEGVGNSISGVVLNNAPLKFSYTLGMPTQVVEQMMAGYKGVAASYSMMKGEEA